MRLRSTGLGNTELEAHIAAIKKVDGLVFFCADVSKPVIWHTRMAFQEEDMRALILALLKRRNLVFICKALLFGRREVPRTEDF